MGTLWGKTRLGIWWWGKGIQEERRNTWLIRHPSVVGQLGSDDTWEILHEHTGGNPGFDKAVLLFKKAMPAMSSAAEAIATAFGTPFLRTDFFIGSEKWGVRLNEVAYGSGTEHRQRASSGNLVSKAQVTRRSACARICRRCHTRPCSASRNSRTSRCRLQWVSSSVPPSRGFPWGVAGLERHQHPNCPLEP